MGAIGGPVGPYEVSGGCPTLGKLRTENEEFVVGTAGVINPAASQPDKYYMNESKVFETCSDGRY